MNLAEGSDAVIELIKDLQDALAIVRVKALNSLNLTLKKAKVEIEISAKDISKAGGKFELGISLDASIKRERTHTHVLSLVLEPIGVTGKLSGDVAHDLADSILALAALRSRVVALKSTDFKGGDMELEVRFERKKSGGLQIVCGGEGESGNTQKVTLFFRE
jgi:hypothetical protein